jgi:hypothetical protein
MNFCPSVVDEMPQISSYRPLRVELRLSLGPTARLAWVESPNPRGLTAAIRLQKRSSPVRAETDPERGRGDGSVASRRAGAKADAIERGPEGRRPTSAGVAETVPGGLTVLEVSKDRTAFDPPLTLTFERAANVSNG